MVNKPFRGGDALENDGGGTDTSVVCWGCARRGALVVGGGVCSFLGNTGAAVGGGVWLGGGICSGGVAAGGGP